MTQIPLSVSKKTRRLLNLHLSRVLKSKIGVFNLIWDWILFLTSDFPGM